MADFLALLVTPPVTVSYIGNQIRDLSPPTVTLVSPIGGTLQKQGTIVFTVSDDRDLTFVLVWMEFADGNTEMVYGYNTSGALEFKPKYRASLAAGTNPRTFTVRRAGGWPSNPRIFVQPVDVGGNTAL